MCYNVLRKKIAHKRSDKMLDLEEYSRKLDILKTKLKEIGDSL